MIAAVKHKHSICSDKPDCERFPWALSLPTLQLLLDKTIQGTMTAVWAAAVRQDHTICNDKPDLESFPWPLISSQAKRFLQLLLDKNHKTRPTALQALHDPYLTKHAMHYTKPLPRLIVDNLLQVSNHERVL